MSRRRQFVRDATAQLAAFMTLGTLPAPRRLPTAGPFDLTWPSRLTGTHRALFDVAEVESGYGLFRAAMWARQCAEHLGARPAEVSPVVVLRSHAVALALRQSFWDRYAVGEIRHVTHPATLKPTARNPALMDESDGLPKPLLDAMLPAQLAQGTTVLACDVALQTWIDHLRARNRASEADARAEAVAALVPGVILQPSGVFAAILAQEHGCHYVRAS